MQLTLNDLKSLYTEYEIKDFEQAVISEASKSTCRKRKVGAIIIGSKDILSWGHNYNENSLCEDINGTNENTVHAEISALTKIRLSENYKDKLIMFITQPPCDNCKETLKEAGIDYYVINSFMKWDKNKLQYSLVPPKAIKALAKVLTYGARKYKPNNWKQVDDTTRYWDALYRHLEAYRAGEITDDESGFNHLEHAITNIAFLIELEVKNV